MEQNNSKEKQDNETLIFSYLKTQKTYNVNLIEELQKKIDELKASKVQIDTTTLTQLIKNFEQAFIEQPKLNRELTLQRLSKRFNNW